MIGRRSRAAQRGFVVEQVHRGEVARKGSYGAPGRLLAGHVRGYRGYWNELGGWARLRLVPSLQVNLDISLGARPQLADSRVVPAGAIYGMRTDSAVLVRAGGEGVLVGLSPHGAYTLLGVSMWELANTVIDVVDVLGPKAELIVERLAETSGWRARVALLDNALAARAEAGPKAARQVVWAWQRLRRSGGRIRIARLADEIGWTRRHLLTRFRDQIGLTPKTAARVIRFQRALQLLQRTGSPPVGAVAQLTGYSDQAHLTREFRALAGITPSELIA